MSSAVSTRPHHRRAASYPHYPTRHITDDNLPFPNPKQMASDNTSHPASPRPKAASRIIQSVRRTLVPSSVPKKRNPEYSKSAVHSTLAESRPLSPPQQFRDPDSTSSRPTIQQIAMGLHISRTPHLRPLRSSSYAFSQRDSAPHSAHPYEHPHHPITLPPPPSRSSMKKPATTVASSSSSPALTPPFSHASGSSTTVTSVTPSSAQSPRSFAALKYRMARFLPHNRSTSAPTSLISSPMSSPRTSTSEFPHPKKAVRFTTEEVDND